MIRPLRRLLLFAALVLLLLVPALRIPLSYLPRTTKPILAVTVTIQGSFAETVEEKITIPLEEELYRLPGLEDMSSVSRREESRILLFFGDNSRADTAYLAVREAVDRAAVRFPVHAQRPRIDQSDPSARPVFVVALPPRDETVLRQRFGGIDGVATVSVGGGARRELLVEPKSEALAAMSLSVPELVRQLRTFEVVGSFQRRGGSPLLVDTRPRRTTDFDDVLLEAGVPLGELAGIGVSVAETDSISRIDGRPTSVVSITAAGGANEVALCRRLRQLSAQIPGSEILHDYGKTVEQIVTEAAVALGVGAIAVAVFTLLFVRLPGSAAAVAGSIPFSAMVSIAALSVFDMKLDAFSLAGIAVGVGLVVDAGAIYVEFHRLSLGNYAAASRAARLPVVVGGFTTVVAFVPLVFAPPTLRNQFAGLTVAITASVTASVFYVLGFLPALLSLGGRRDKNGVSSHNGAASLSRGQVSTPSWFGWFFEGIAGSRRWLRFPMIAAALAVPLILVSLPRESGIAVEDDLLRATLEYPAATTPEAVEADARRLEEGLVSHPAVRLVAVTFEEERARFEVNTANVAEVRNWSKRAVALSNLSGFLYYPDAVPNEGRIPVLVTAPNPEDARSAARELASAAEALPGVDRVVLHFKESPDAAIVLVDIEAARHQGVNPRLAATALYWNIAGPVAAKWRPPGQELDVRVPPRELSIEDVLSEVFVPGRGSETYGNAHAGMRPVPIPLGAVASTSRGPHSTRIHRHNRRHSARLSVLVDRDSLGNTTTALRSMADSLSLPRRTTVAVDSQARKREAERQSLLLVALLSVFLVLLTILAAFESAKAVGLCLLQLPLAWLLPAVYLSATDSSLNPAVVLGLLVTAGVAVNNTILVLENLSRNPPMLALWRAFRPMITATATTVVGVLPLAFLGSASFLGIVALVLSFGTLGSFLSLVVTFPGARLLRPSPEHRSGSGNREKIRKSR